MFARKIYRFCREFPAPDESEVNAVICAAITAESRHIWQQLHRSVAADVHVPADIRGVKIKVCAPLRDTFSYEITPLNHLLTRLSMRGCMHTTVAVCGS
jgi:hypothetical protein